MAFRSVILVLSLLASSTLMAQSQALIFGKVTDEDQKPVELVNIAIIGTPGGTTTDEEGEYKLIIPSNRELAVAFSFIGYDRKEVKIALEPGERREINVEMKLAATQLPDVIVEDEKVRRSSLVRVNPKTVKVIPGVTGGVESIIKTMPGVSSSNELSSQYSVRGGNYDENLVYVNGVEIYRPFLIRSGEQEGLSFLNSDMVSGILFSAGGFDAKYGDKMSSVLDIQYKKPIEFGGSLSGSLLGGSLHLEGASDNLRFTYLAGVRYKTNEYLLNSLETEGEYKPSFFDAQTYFTYDLNEKTEVSFLGNYANNQFNLVPENRETKFGTVNEAYKLQIYFDGQEVDRFDTWMGALSLKNRPGDNLTLRLTGSAYRSLESETFDIQGQYWIGRLETDFGSDEFGDILEAQGVGTYLNHARNELDLFVYNIQHDADAIFGNNQLEWGMKYQREQIDDRLREWEMIDSAGYSLPRPADSIGVPSDPGPLVLSEFFRLDTNLNSNRYTAYVQNTFAFELDSAEFSITAGIRGHYWDLNEEFLFSPRATISFKPNWKRDILFRFSTGLYYQPPFYRELRDQQGNINTEIEAQKSLHFVLGSDWNFRIWSRPFKFITEVYYKKLENLIPYEIENVRIRYYGDNMADGYAAGIDMKVNGEFVKGAESWASLSVMQIQEDLQNDFYYEYYNEAGEQIIPGYTSDDVAADSVRIEPGYIPRPTDRRVSFSIFFQDYIPNFPTWKMNLHLTYGTGLPFGPKNSPRYQQTLRMPDYRRVDIGFSKILIGGESKMKPANFLKHVEEMWVTLEVLNLLQISNTVSYLWVRDVTNRQYAVPNYLTPRQINLKLVMQF